MKRRRGTAIVETEHGVLLTAMSKGGFLLPGGGTNHNETRFRAAIRELEEETGLVGKKENLIDLGIIAPDSGVINGRVKIFFVKAEKIRTDRVSEFGLGKLSFYSPLEITNLIKQNKLIDSFTLVAFYRAIVEGHIILN